MHVDLSAVSVRFGRAVILHEITCTFEPGRIVVLVGANGAGKSTLLDCLSGFLPVSAGRIRVDGAATRTRQRVRLAARLHQRTVLPETIRCGDFLRLAANPAAGTWMLSRRNPHVEADVGTRSISPLLEAGRIAPESPIANLSGGQRRLVALAAVLLTGKPMFLLDEPFAGISPGIEAVVRSAIRAHAAGRIVLVAEHDLDAVERLADEVLVLQNGRIRDTLKGQPLDRARLVPHFTR